MWLLSGVFLYGCYLKNSIFENRESQGFLSGLAFQPNLFKAQVPPISTSFASVLTLEISQVLMLAVLFGRWSKPRCGARPCFASTGPDPFDSVRINELCLRFSSDHYSDLLRNVSLFQWLLREWQIDMVLRRVTVLWFGSSAK